MIEWFAGLSFLQVTLLGVAIGIGWAIGDFLRASYDRVAERERQSKH